MKADILNEMSGPYIYDLQLNELTLTKMCLVMMYAQHMFRSKVKWINISSISQKILKDKLWAIT